MDITERNRASAFARAVKLRAAADGNIVAAERMALDRHGAGSAELSIINKAAVSPALTTSANWAGSIAVAAERAFVGAVAEMAIFGRMSQVPPNINVSGLTTSATASFVSEGSPAPLTSMVIASEALEPKQVAGTLVISQELARLADPRAETIFERELRKALLNAIDGAMLSTTAASGSKPAGLFNGVTAVTATSDATADIRDLVDSFDGDLTSAFFVASPKVAASLADPARPLAGIRSGELLNAPFFVTRNAPAGVLALIDGDGVFCATGGIDVSVAREASALMADNPSAPGAMVSFWQAGLVGIRLSLNIDWAAARPGSVALISGAAW